jgi:hypothetical protein
MKTSVDDEGYHYVPLYRDGKSQNIRVHRIVLTAFDRPPNRGEQGCHRDDDKGNNHIANLRWGSASDNWNDRIRHGRARSYNKLNQQQVDQIREMAVAGHRPSHIARKFGISHPQVNNITRGAQWSTKPPFSWPLTNFLVGAASVSDFYRDRGFLTGGKD